MKRVALLAIVCAAVFAACGGGGGGGVTAGGGGGGVIPTPSPAGNLPLSEAVAGTPAWVNPSSHKTLYYLDVDTATTQLCTTSSGCVGLWPIFAPVAGSANTDNMTIITRSDGAGQQWAYAGHPLYTYSGDSAADQTNGDGLPDFGGHWHVARPAASGTTTPPPGDPVCHGYC